MGQTSRSPEKAERAKKGIISSPPLEGTELEGTYISAAKTHKLRSGHFWEGAWLREAYMPGAEEQEKMLTAESTDLDLLDRFLTVGDEEAFRRLVERQLPMIQRLLIVLFKGSKEDIEDAQQEVLLSLYLSLPGFKTSSSLKTFVYRICKNKAVDLLRKKGSERRKWQALRRVWSEELKTDSSADPSRLLLNRETAEKLSEALYRLKLEERTVIFLKDVEGLSVREIAEITGLTEGSIKTRCHRGRKKLADMMRSYYHDE